MQMRERCGQSFGIYVCDKDRNHDGDHRGYSEERDEPLFWPDREGAMIRLFDWARLETPDVPEPTVRAIAHALGDMISVDEAHEALRAAQRGLTSGGAQGEAPPQ